MRNEILGYRIFSYQNNYVRETYIREHLQSSEAIIFMRGKAGKNLQWSMIEKIGKAAANEIF